MNPATSASLALRAASPPHSAAVPFSSVRDLRRIEADVADALPRAAHVDEDRVAVHDPQDARGGVVGGVGVALPGCGVGRPRGLRRVREGDDRHEHGGEQQDDEDADEPLGTHQ